MEHSRKKLELTGQRYGRLTVLEPAENIGTRTAWLCRCDCGREIVAKTIHLRNGHVKSCGAECPLRKRAAKKKAVRKPGEKQGGVYSLTYIDGTCVEMLQTRTVRSNNTSGVPGVDWLMKKQRWRASICFKGKRRYLGSYSRFEDAVGARKRAEEELFEPFLSEFSVETAQRASDN